MFLTVHQKSARSQLVAGASSIVARGRSLLPHIDPFAGFLRIWRRTSDILLPHTVNETNEIPESAPPPSRRGPWKKILAACGLILLKLKSILGLLKLASLGKFALTGLSMAVMIWVEAQRGGILFGVGFVLLLLLHEMGHALAIRRAGLRAGWPVFIPFFGAMIALKDAPPSRGVEAFIAYGGPLAGTVASLLSAALYLVTGERVFLALAYTGFFLNLFNLIPISPLDGGRIAQAFSRHAWILGGLLLGGLFLFSRAPQLLLIGFFALMHVFRRRRVPDTDLAAQAASPEEQRTWSTRYFGLCFFLGAAIFLSRRILEGI